MKRWCSVFMLPGAILLAGDLSLTLPEVRTTVAVGNEQVPVSVGGRLERVTREGSTQVFRLTIESDLSGLQDHATALVKAQLDRDERCSERIDVHNVRLEPRDPAALLTVELYYERRMCIKLMGRQSAKRLAAGNAVVEVKLTPVVEDERRVRLNAEAGEIRADGSLGEALRSGALGTMLRDKVRASLEKALLKGTDLQGSLPPVVEEFCRIGEARFYTRAGGRLGLRAAVEAKVPQAKADEVLKAIGAGR